MNLNRGDDSVRGFATGINNTQDSRIDGGFGGRDFIFELEMDKVELLV
ncbi:hypothetical protein [Nostoc sp.]